jgi:hypothetical protein
MAVRRGRLGTVVGTSVAAGNGAAAGAGSRGILSGEDNPVSASSLKSLQRTGSSSNSSRSDSSSDCSSSDSKEGVEHHAVPVMPA